MNVQISSKNWNVPEADREQLERRIARITKKLPHMNADLLHLVVRIDKQPKRDQYLCSARLGILKRVIAARGKYNANARAAIGETFDDLERTLDKFMAALKART